MKLILLIAALLVSTIAHTHEGHGPESIIAPHGGVIRDGKILVAELVSDDNGAKIYLFDHDVKPVAAADFKIATDKLSLTDAKKKAVKFEAKLEQNSVLLKFDKSTSYRFSVTLPVEYKGKKETFNWQFEPQAN